MKNVFFLVSGHRVGWILVQHLVSAPNENLVLKKIWSLFFYVVPVSALLRMFSVRHNGGVPRVCSAILVNRSFPLILHDNARPDTEQQMVF